MLINHPKSELVPVQSLIHLGFQVDFEKGRLLVPTAKLKAMSGSGDYRLGRHFRPSEMFSHGHALLSGIHGAPSAVWSSSKVAWVGCVGPHPRDIQLTEFASKIASTILGREKFRWGGPSPNPPFRLLRPRLGRPGCNFRLPNSGILARSRVLIHQCEGVTGCGGHRKVPCPSWGGGSPLPGQQCCLLLPQERRWKAAAPKCPNGVPVAVVHDASHSSASKPSCLQGAAGRWPKPHPHGSGGLQSFLPCVFPPIACNPTMGSTQNRHVCLPRERTVAPFCLSLSPLAGRARGCNVLQSKSGQGLLRQPPLDHHPSLAQSFGGPSQGDLPDDHTLLGFSFVVSPFVAPKKKGQSNMVVAPPLGVVHRLLGGSDAPHKVAPSLHGVVRELLQQQAMSNEAIATILAAIPSLPRYNQAFGVLWHHCLAAGLDPVQCSPDQLAAELVVLNKVQPSQARHAYAAMLHVPGFASLRFSPLLRSVKRAWNQASPKYATFWDGGSVLQKLASQPLNWDSVSQVRDRMILVWRLVQLARSVDLQRTFRKVCLIDKQPFVWIRRKGWPLPRWEEVVSLEGLPTCSPWHLLCHYVHLTREFVAPGSPVLISTCPPYKPLQANTLGSITKRLLFPLGISGGWGAHSTRGAGVLMYKRLGLTSEQVCEIGKWKNSQAFSDHYLRLGAPRVAATKLFSLVHNVSPERSAEPDLSRTPGNLGDPGGRDKEGVAQSEGEPTLPSQAPSTLSLPSTVALNGAPRSSSTKKRPLSSLADSCGPVKFQFALQRQPPSTKSQ